MRQPLRFASKGIILYCCVTGPGAFAQSPHGEHSEATIPTNLPNVVTYKLPPAGFDPLKATDAEIARYGYPPRPDPLQAPRFYALWQKMVSPKQHRLLDPKLEQTNLEGRPADIRESNQGNLSGSPVMGTSSNWSGYVVVGPNGTFVGSPANMFTEIVVPVGQQAFGVCSGGTDYAFLWAGFDGYGSSDVLQAGVEVDASCASGITQASYYAWYEWYPNVETHISNFPVSAGDTIAVDVWYTTDSSYYGHAQIQNFSTNKSVTLGFNPPSGTTFVGNSTEWVVEAPTIDGSLATLTNYISAPFNFTVTQVCNSTGCNNYYYPSSSPVGTTIYDVTMEPGSSPISYVDEYGLGTLWFFDEGTAECVPATSCDNAGTNTTN